MPLECWTGISLVMVCVSTGFAPDPVLTLVKDGQPMSVIVTNGRPNDSQTLAATELQEHLRLMSGATIPIVKENELAADASRVLILLGSSNLTKQHGIDVANFEPETFVVRTKANVLLLVGDDAGGKSNPRTGTLFAVYDFLQDQLGCRWIWPGDIGRVVPRRTTITVQQLDIRETPVVKVRGMRMVNQDRHRADYEQSGLGKFLDLGFVYDQVGADERLWLQRMRMGKSFNLSYGHAFTDWWERHGESRPEIFALLESGKRGPAKPNKPDFVKMCVSNPQLWELQLDPLRARAAAGARGFWLNACENDGAAGFCTCANCRAWDAAPAGKPAAKPVEDGSDVDGARSKSALPESLSDRYAHWYNELARRARDIDPEARVIAYAYSRYRAPPATIDRLEPNLWIGYIGFNAYPRSEAARQQSIDEWVGWSQRGATVFLRSNSLFYLGEGAPLVVNHQLAADTKFQIEHGLRATDYDCLQGNWATTGPSYYVLARMLWDTDADVDQLLSEFYSAFGPMQPVVKEYYEHWENFTTRLGQDEKFMALNRTERLQAYPQQYDADTFARAQAILDKAKSLLPQATPAERERFQNVQLGLEHGRLLVAALQDGKTSNGPEGEQLLKFRREVAARNVVNVYWTTSKEFRFRVFE